MFKICDYNMMHKICFSDDYPGYRPNVKELPNGDGKVDADKRYAHIATKYIDQYAGNEHRRSLLWNYLMQAHMLAYKVADALQVPHPFRPSLEHSALRILEYPVGATSNLHTDFDLFTLMMHRDQPECFVAHEQMGSKSDLRAYGRFKEARKLNPQLHLGELGELVGLGPATPHEVIASDKTQYAIVYFAIPNHVAVLPQSSEKLLADGPLTVGTWLEERLARSRAYT